MQNDVYALELHRINTGVGDLRGGYDSGPGLVGGLPGPEDNLILDGDEQVDKVLCDGGDHEKADGWLEIFRMAKYLEREE